MEQWRHTGSVAGAPPADSETDEGCEPERGTYLVISILRRVKVPAPARARATGASSKAAGAAPAGTGTASGEGQNGCAQELELRQGEITLSGRGLLTGGR